MAIIDPQKRREIMRRSMKIGACICDPRRKCPCDVFTDHGLCPCAGERPDPQVESDKPIELMQLVHNAGCASKIPAGDLQDLLAGLPLSDDPNILVGAAAGDDAGIYALNDHTTLVQTVDVFTPCVDDAYKFGRICAANCLSDIYAMGATPKTALSILCFPIESVPAQVMRQMMLGACEVLNDAGVALIGGHSVKDEEIKLGFAITGCIPRQAALTRDQLNTGDMLVLTKPLGVGALNFARQIGKASCCDIEEAEKWMMQLNDKASQLAVKCGATACTDITGFGLFGHLIGMLRSSGHSATVFADKLPAIGSVREVLAAEIIPGAIERNREYVADDISIDDSAGEIDTLLGFDGQTSGGLLIAISPEKTDALCSQLDFAAVIGQVGQPADGHIYLTAGGEKLTASDCCCKSVAKDAPPATQSCCSGEAAAKADEKAPSCCCDSETDADDDHSDCCSDIFGDCGQADAGSCCSSSENCGAANADDQQISQNFASFISSCNNAPQLSGQQAELINFALAVGLRCENCVKYHIQKALEVGITRDQLDAAAWLAVSMGGAVVKSFWDSCRRQYL